MRHKRIVIDLQFEDLTDPQANEVCDAIAQNCLSEDELMPTVLECLEANGIKGNVEWTVRRESWTQP